MCGRFYLAVTPQELAHLFGLPEAPAFAPRYNIAPTQPVLTVRSALGGDRQWATSRWGLVPSWAKDPAIGASMINARAETVAEKPAFRSAVRRRRCLIPASGFYEWRKTGSGKQPYLIQLRDGRPFAMAGLWERWQPEEGEPLETCTIITTTPNPVVAELHDRMPVILAPERFEEWLRRTPLAPERLEQLLVPFAATAMESYEVSTRVNSPSNDDPSCIERSTLF